MLVRHRPKLLAVLAAVLIASLSACQLGPSQQTAFIALNRDRAAVGAPALPNRTPDVQAKAQAWAERLASEHALYHSTLSDDISVRWCALGENVAYGPSVAANEVAFMNSPGHRSNIVSRSWNGVGVGVASNGNTVWTVQVFVRTC